MDQFGTWRRPLSRYLVICLVALKVVLSVAGASESGVGKGRTKGPDPGAIQNRVNDGDRLNPASSGTVASAEVVGRMKRPLTVDDVLRMEDLGLAVFVDNNRKILFEQMGPYEEGPNFGAVSAGDRSVQAALYTWDTESGEVRPLLENARKGGNWLASVSPDRRWVLSYSLADGALRLVAIDVSTGSSKTLPYSPNCCGTSLRGDGPFWLSNREIIYASASDGYVPPILRRQTITSRLTSLWAGAFSGKAPSATVMRSSKRGVNLTDENPRGALVRFDLVTGKTVEIVKGSIVSWRLSSDNRFIAVLAEIGSTQPDRTVLPNAETVRVFELIVADLETNTVKTSPCQDCNVIANSVTWSPTGNHLTFLAHRFDRGARDLSLYSYDAQHETKAKRLAPHRFVAGCGGAHYEGKAQSLDAGSVVAFGRLASGHETVGFMDSCGQGNGSRNDWFLLDGDVARNVSKGRSRPQDIIAATDRSGAYIFADGELLHVSPGAHRVRPIPLPGKARSGWRLVRNNDAIRDRGVIAFDSGPSILTLRLATRQVAVLEKPSEASSLVDLADSGRAAIFRTDSSNGSSLSLKMADQPAREIARVNRFLSEITEDRTANIDYLSPDGTQKLSSCMLLPPTWTPKQRYPLVVRVYPNVSGRCSLPSRSHFSPMSLRLLANHGYIVLYVAAPRALIRTPKGPEQGLAALVEAAVDKAIDEGYADPKRLGLYGFSQGFHSALQVLTESDRFQAAVIGNGIADFASHYGQLTLTEQMSGSTYMYPQTRYEAGSDNSLYVRPWEDPPAYIRNSPTFSPESITTPLLILHSDLDEFPLAQSQQIFGALYRLRKEATYVTYWGEGHGNTSPPNVRDVWRRIFEWYDARLGTPSSRDSRTH